MLFWVHFYAISVGFGFIGFLSICRLATSRPHEFQGRICSARCSAAKRPLFTSRSDRASDEAARGRLVSLEGFSFAFRAKMMSGVTCNWSDDIWKLNGGKCRFHSNQNNRMCVCFSCVERAN